MRRVHRFMSDWRKFSLVALSITGLAFLLYWAAIPALEPVADGILVVYAVVLVVFAGKWIGGHPEDFR